MCGFNEKHVIPLAHSADAKYNIPPQTYADHVCNVESKAVLSAKFIVRYARHDSSLFLETVRCSAEYHDLGKLDSDNQAVLRGEHNARHLPVQHTEAGTVYLLNRQNMATGATLVRSHHIGLPDFVTEQNRTEDEVLRDENEEIRQRIDKTLNALLSVHNTMRPNSIESSDGSVQGNAGLFFRLAFSCLVDADHYDTARHYNDAIPFGGVALKPKERLQLLDVYV